MSRKSRGFLVWVCFFLFIFYLKQLQHWWMLRRSVAATLTSPSVDCQLDSTLQIQILSLTLGIHDTELIEVREEVGAGAHTGQDGQQREHAVSNDGDILVSELPRIEDLMPPTGTEAITNLCPKERRVERVREAHERKHICPRPVFTHPCDNLGGTQLDVEVEHGARVPPVVLEGEALDAVVLRYGGEEVGRDAGGGTRGADGGVGGWRGGGGEWGGQRGGGHAGRRRGDARVGR